jgi:glutathione peroxidase
VQTAFDFIVSDISGKRVDLAQYRGHVLLIVNTASRCGFTPQYKGLQELHQRYKDRGLVVLGFPCDQFGHQEPGSDDEIHRFCEANFGITFPLFQKIDVNGANAAPVFKHLKKAAKGAMGTQGIKWNFTKFLVSRDGSRVSRFGSATKPEELVREIEEQLGPISDSL